MKELKVALVHDWILGLGGAERTLKVLHEMFPEAPIYTFFYNKKFTSQFLPKANIKASFIQNLYKLKILNHKLFLPLLPMAAESFDLSNFDLVISSSVAFSKGLILKPKTKHICYCHSPTRFLWDWHREYLKRFDLGLLKKSNLGLSGWGIRIIQHFLRIWDRQAANRVDQFVANSKTVQQRIKKYYGRDSIVIYPPIETLGQHTSSDLRKSQRDFLIAQSGSSCQEPRPLDQKLQRAGSLTNRATRHFERPQRHDGQSFQDYYLIVSRLFSHKNIDIAIKAFNKLELPLIIIGSGPEYGRLKKMVENKSMIKLLGEIPDEKLEEYYTNAKAFIMPQEEDFGMTPIEAMSCGKPVLALRRGGALEYVLEGINGEFFDDPHPAVLADGVRRLNENYKNYSPLVIKKTAERFSRSRFEEEICHLVFL